MPFLSPTFGYWTWPWCPSYSGGWRVRNPDRVSSKTCNFILVVIPNTYRYGRGYHNPSIITPRVWQPRQPFNEGNRSLKSELQFAIPWGLTPVKYNTDRPAKQKRPLGEQHQPMATQVLASEAEVAGYLCSGAGLASMQSVPWQAGQHHWLHSCDQTWGKMLWIM